MVICAYTSAREANLRGAVASVLSQRHRVAEVTVVVDHNLELLARARGYWPAPIVGERPPVRVIPSAGLRGLSGARNSGVAASSGEIVAFLDDDAEAEPDWSERLLAPYADPSILACGGAAIARYAAACPAWWPAEFDWVVGCSYRGLPTRRADVRNLIGANMSVRRSALTELNGFADGVGRVGDRPLGCEETEFCIRLVQRWPSGRIVYEPAARVLHDVPGERTGWPYFRARCFAEGMSKAIVAARVGTRPALASERSYAVRVLPRGVAVGIWQASRGEPAAGRRAGAIIAGLAITTAGYVRGRLTGSPLAPTDPRTDPDPDPSPGRRRGAGLAASTRRPRGRATASGRRRIAA